MNICDDEGTIVGLTFKGYAHHGTHRAVRTIATHHIERPLSAGSPFVFDVNGNAGFILLDISHPGLTKHFRAGLNRPGFQYFFRVELRQKQYIREPRIEVPEVKISFSVAEGCVTTG